MRIDTWFQAWCPGCKKPNWICQGNTNDLTGVDKDGFKCFNCGKESLFDDEGDEIDQPSDPYYVDGKEKP